MIDDALVVIAERWEPDTPLTVFAGPGNNGGDALALARLLAGKGYRLEVYLFMRSCTSNPTTMVNWMSIIRFMYGRQALAHNLI